MGSREEAEGGVGRVGGGPGRSSVGGRVVEGSSGGVRSERPCARECPACGWVYPEEHALCTRCGAELVPSALPKCIPGRLEIERRIAAGGSGIVYRGIDLTLGRRIAVKTRSALAPGDVERLRREAQALAAVSHRHLATVYGFEVHRGHPLILMEWLDGGTLAERIPLPLEAAVEVMLQVSDALDGLHAAGIVHRDIKPRNIGFTGAGELKLLDFGLAHPKTDGGFEGEACPRIAGTLSYMPPEAFSRERPSPIFDLWALNVVFYEALTGCRPFVGENPSQLVEAIRDLRYRPIEAHLPAAPRDLRAFFEEAFGGGSRRPADVSQLRSRLSDLRRAAG